MKITYVKRGWRNEYGSDSRSYEHYLNSRENKAWKISGLYWIWTRNRLSSSAKGFGLLSWLYSSATPRY